jgi:hypothetical protein
MADDTTRAERQTLTVVFGNRKLTGWRATVVAGAFGAAYDAYRDTWAWIPPLG